MRTLITPLWMILTLWPGAAVAADAPQWLREVAASKLPEYSGKVSAAVLLNEKKVTVEESGRMEIVKRYAVKILNREGRARAVADYVYTTDTVKVRDLRAWLVYASGHVKAYGKSETLDRAEAPNDTYNEVRVRLIVASEDADAGSVFGFELASEDRSVFTQFEWEFQDDLPVLLSRFTLALPKGWRAESFTYNHTSVEPLLSHSTYSWQLGQLPDIEKEPAAPSISSLVPRLVVSFYPPEGARAPTGPAFHAWVDVSRWVTGLFEPQGKVTDALSAKARSLTGEAAGEMERIQAIGRFVQGVNYIAIETGLGRGGGYRPHAAAEVLEKSYGDCKDKANLMRVLLRAVGVESYPVLIYLGGRTRVQPEWPSPQQFNHVIVAVPVSERVQAPAVAPDTKLGRLLLFDPTDADTPVGYLPLHEQDSLALVVAGEAGALLRMPAAKPEVNRVERHTAVSMTSDGSITASFRDQSFGEAAVENEKLLHRQAAEFRKRIERSISQRASAATISKIDAKEQTGGSFSLEVDFAAPFYGQTMQDRLLVFKPAVTPGPDVLPSGEVNRKHPVVLNAQTYSETARVQLPAGFRIDEAPEAVHATTPFASYVASWEDKGNELVFSQRLEMRTATMPAEQYPVVRSFFAQVNAASAAPVVLTRR